MVTKKQATKDNLDSAFEKAHKELPSPTEPDPGIMAAFSTYRTTVERVDALIYAVACIGGKGLAKDLRDWGVARKGIRIDEIEDEVDTSPTDKG